MEYYVGQSVIIHRLGRTGVIAEVLRDGRLRVTLGSMPVTCTADELAPAKESSKKKKKAEPEPAVKLVSSSPAPSARSLASLDLHGLRVDEALSRLEQHLDRAVLAKVDRVEVIHGIGTGRVKDAVLKRLGELSIVERFAPMDGNAGTTIVYL